MLKLEDYIWYEPNFLDSGICDEIIDRSKSSSDFNSGAIGAENAVNTEVRDVDMLSFREWPDLDQALFQAYGKAIREYGNKFTYLGVRQDEGYLLLRYGKGQHYREHVDCFATSSRKMTAIFGLNDDYTGGEFWFWGGAWRRRVEKGALLMFPSSFQYPHGVQPIESGVRYSVITWFL